jgi:hypothetical protein
MKAIEAFKALILRISVACNKRYGGPGEVVKNMPDNYRKALKELKSEDIGPNVRLDELGSTFVGTDEYYENKGFEADRLEFDKKILKR